MSGHNLVEITGNLIVHHPVSPEDRAVAAWWGYTEQQWAELPALVQVDKRETVTWARTA